MANWSTKDLAEHYRRMGSKCPVQDACGSGHSKFGVAPKEERTANGIVFASKREMEVYCQLRIAEQVGAISDLELQPRYVLQVAGADATGMLKRPIVYVADFRFTQEGKTRVVDVKGVETPVFKLKLKLMRERYPDVTVEVWK